jgi:hypothetical protein
LYPSTSGLGHIEELGESLLATFAGQTMAMEEIYKKHGADKRFVKRNYKGALRTLEREKKISVVLLLIKERR